MLDFSALSPPYLGHGGLSCIIQFVKTAWQYLHSLSHYTSQQGC